MSDDLRGEPWTESDVDFDHVMGRPVYFDRDGTPITFKEWGRLRFGDVRGDRLMDYCRVASTLVGEVWVSTVWLGIDHGFRSDGPPIIFETMVFGGGDTYDGWQDRYATEADALAGHQGVVALLAVDFLVVPIEDYRPEGDL